jgi:glucoamylase
MNPWELTEANIWRFNHKVNSTKWGEPIRIEVLAKARMHWSFDKWQTVYNEEMTDSGTGLQYMDILPSMLEIPTTIEFTFYWIESQRWEGTNFTIEIRPL